MHELSTIEAGPGTDAVQARDVARWRKAERERLIAARLALSVTEREEHTRLIARQLGLVVPHTPGTVVALFWPYRGEPDLRPWMLDIHRAGLRTALPVVVTKQEPLMFREWTPGAAMTRGVLNIPIPAEDARVLPTVVIAPLVGFDMACYRLGYGGGYFDRNLAAMTPKPLIIGVGHPIQKLTTIFPQAYDIPMNWIITGLSAPMCAEAVS